MGLFDLTPSRPPCVMISSTFYDLRQIRDDLRQFIEGVGYRPLLSEHASFPIDPDATTIENCRRRVEQDADILVLVIGGRYGSIDATPNKSVTNLEYTSARHKRIPIYVFIDPQVLALLPLWKRNPAADFSGQVDSPRLFEFIEHVRTIDSVWMTEFKSARDIIDALRTQFAFQQQTGLRLQRQTLSLADQDWFDTLHGETLRVALDRPPAWEYLLFASALRDGVARHRRLARTHALKIPIGFGEDVQDPLAWIRTRLMDARRLTSSLNDLMKGALQEALGPEGAPGDTGAIVFVADTIADLYRDALLWSLRLRTANVDERFQQMAAALGDMMDDVVQQVAKFGPYAKAQVEEALAAPKTGVPRVIKMTLTISMPEAAAQSFNDELERLTREMSDGAHC